MIRISKNTREMGLDIIVNGSNQLTYCKLSLQTKGSSLIRLPRRPAKAGLLAMTTF
jgi:hypothetical protein